MCSINRFGTLTAVLCFITIFNTSSHAAFSNHSTVQTDTPPTITHHSVAAPNPHVQDPHAVKFFNWISAYSLSASPGRCVTSFSGSSDPEQNNHSHTWDNAVNGILALSLDSLQFAGEITDFISSGHIWNYPFKGCFQAVSIDISPPRADDTLDWYTKIGHSSAANISIVQYGLISQEEVYIDTALDRIDRLLTWLDTDTIPYFPEVEPANVIAGNLIPFADTPWYSGSDLYKSFEETMEFVISLHWASIVTDDGRYDDLALAVFDSLVANYWDSGRNIFYSGESLVNGNYVKNDAVAFDVFTTVYLGMSQWSDLEPIFTDRTGFTKEEWLLDKLENGLDGLIVSGDSLEGVRFSDNGIMIICTECTGDILACIWELDPERGQLWYDEFAALQAEDGSWWAGYDPDTAEPSGFDSGFGFSYDGKIAIAAKMALGMERTNWYDVVHGSVEVQDEGISGSLDPRVFECYQNHPNPFNPSTTLSIKLEEAGYVVGDVYNLRGQHIKRLVERKMEAGFHELTWDGTDARGVSAPSGVYFIRFESSGFQIVKKMILLR